MDYKDKIRIALILVCLTASSLIFTSEYRRRRRRGDRHNCPRSSCYLHSDQKPQLRFKRVLADNSFSPFNHLNLKKGSSLSSHPYESEINALIENPFRAGIELDFDANLDIEMSDCYVWVETESQLNELADELSKERVFAVDTEQHSLRSFLGFTALVQISTRKRDYLLDMIVLHDVMGVLGPVFANPNICKVFHGADNDVLWLQRDFHIYVVNLFDTAKACEVLLKPQKSLAYLLETYCSVATNKLLQREDWRQRPLSAEMLQYARTDAHYLLYIASSLIVELKQLGSGNSSTLDDKLNYTAEASRHSNMTCLQLYSKETEVPPGESAALSIFSRHLNREGSLSISCETQDFVRCLCAWRDLMDLCINDPFDIGSAITVNQKKSKDKLIKFMWYLYNMARIHDESSRFVLSDQAIVALVEKIPKTQHELSDTISQADLSSDPANINVALQSPSLVVCSHLDDLYALIQGKDVEAENVFQMLLEKCLGPNGCCPLSIYNYALLFNCDLKLTSSRGSKQNGFKNSRQTAQKASRELFVQKFSCKAPVYHNCRIYANDGRLLCYCDRRKLEWYLRRDLAKLVEDDPPAIMLLFEPKGRPEDEGNDFYIQSKKNICVGCGEGSHYLRYRIIPSCYRMHFPEHLKSHRSHDIVLLCVDCHEVAHAAAEKHKKQTAAEFGIPLFVRKVVESKEQPAISWPDASIMRVDEVGISPLQLRTAAMALLRHGERMPFERHNELMQIVMQYYGGREITQEDLQKALLVGMSPHERRKFEKKRGMSKHSGGRNFQQKKQVNNVDTVTKLAIGSVPKIDASHGSQSFSKAEPAGRKEDNGHTFAVTHDDCNASSDLYVVGASATVCKHVNKDDDLGVADDNLRCTGCEGSTPPKNNLKISLLGHGPHGKQVVNHILEEYGEDGVHEFCQRWRKVFVEAIQPRFLPSGWDVMHSVLPVAEGILVTSAFTILPRKHLLPSDLPICQLLPGLR